MTLILFFFSHYIDNTGITGSGVFGRRVGHNHYLLDICRRSLLQVVFPGILTKVGRLVVYKNLHMRDSSQGNCSIHFNTHTRHILQGVRYRTALYTLVKPHPIDNSLSFGYKNVLSCNNLSHSDHHGQKKKFY